MIEKRQLPPPDLGDIVLGLTSTATSATATSDSLAQTDSSLDVPTGTSTNGIAGATVPATTNAGDAPTTTTYEVPATTADVSSSSPTAVLTDDSSSSGGGGLSQDAKIGLGVGLGVGLTLLLALIAVLCLMRRRRRRQVQKGKYTPQAQSDLSMVEAPRGMPAAQAHNPLDEHYEPPKHYDEYQEFEPPGYHPAYETPVSAMAPSDFEIPAPRSVPNAPPVLTIPGPERSPLHSVVPSVVHSPVQDRSPVSPVSISPVSPVGSRAPSPKYHQ